MARNRVALAMFGPNLSLMRILPLLLAVAFLAVDVRAQDATFDPTFNPADVGFGMGDGPAGSVLCSIALPDGRSLIGGGFSFFDGISCGNMVRLNTDGTLDQTYTFAGTNGAVFAMIRQPDGRVIIAGNFTTVNGTTANSIARLLADGSLDPSFNAGAGFTEGTPRALALQVDGKVIVGGYFLKCQNVYAGRIARLNTDGSRDFSFSTGFGFDAEVRAVEVDAAGRVLAGGTFADFNGTQRTCLARLHSDGSLDTGFMDESIEGIGVGSGPFIYGQWSVNDIAIRPSGTILFCGNFGSVNGTPRSQLAEVDAVSGAVITGFASAQHCNSAIFGVEYYAVLVMPDGTVIVGGEFPWCDGDGDGFGDPSHKRGLAKFGLDGAIIGAFHPMSLPGTRNGFHLVKTLSLFSDGSVLVGGAFLQNAAGGHGMAKVSPAGDLDPLFHANGSGADGTVLHVAVAGDDAVIVAGDMGTVNGQASHATARFLADGTLDAGFSPAEFYPPAPNFVWWRSSPIQSVLMQPDGKLLRAVSGNYPFNRLLTSGAADPTYTAPPLIGLSTPYAMARQSTGAVIMINDFTPPHTQAFGPNGGVVTVPDVEWLYASSARLLVLSDDRILVAASSLYHQYESGSIPIPGNMVRLFADGTQDLSLAAVNLTIPPYTSPVTAMAEQSDGKVILVGPFTEVNGVPRNGIARLNANGTLDATFDPGTGFDGAVTCMVLRPDGHIVVGGLFEEYNGAVSRFLVQLNSDGSIDTGFDVGTKFEHYGGGGGVHALGLQSTGHLIVAGEFTSYDGNGRNRVLRLGTATPAGLALSARVFLEGAMLGGGFMSDALRAAGHIPLTEPYTALGFSPVGNNGGESTTVQVLNAPMNSAVVDWVHVELRSPNDPSVVVASRNGLLVQSGFIQDVDGLSPLSFYGVPPGAYYISVHHRNHLGVMSADPIQLGTSPTYLDFTQPYTFTYGIDARKYAFPDMVLYAGDVNHDGTLRYVGEDNDRDPVLLSIGGNIPTSTVTGYKQEDINLDGVVKYVGEGNDRDPILLNIGGNIPTNTRQAQLP